MTTALRRFPVLVVGIVIGLVFGGAELARSGVAWRGLLGAAFPVGYAMLVTALGRRSETFSVLAGRPVDERFEHMNLEASAWSLGLSAVVVLGAFVIAETTGGDPLPYAFIGAVMALSYVGSLALARVRG